MNWESTGPRTTDGKARAARNADKGGGWRETRELFKLLNHTMRQQKEMLIDGVADPNEINGHF